MVEVEKIEPPTYERYVQNFKRHYSVFGKKRIKSVTPKEYAVFLQEELAEKHLTFKAFTNLKTITKGIVKYAGEQELITYTYEEVLLHLNVNKKEYANVYKEDYQEVFTEEEFPKVIEHLLAKKDSVNLALLLMFVTGLRGGEVVALKKSDFSTNTVNVRRTETRLKRNGKTVYEIKDFPKSEAGWRTVPIPDDYIWLIEAILKINPSGEYAFLNLHGERMTTNSLRSRLKTICQRAGVYEKSPHKIRKTYASILLDEKVDARTIQKNMGHASILTTENKYHRSRKDINRVQEILSEIPEFKKM